MRTWGPLAAVSLGTFMLLLDVTIVIVALPDMAASLGSTFSGLQWVIDVYALVLAALLLGAGAAADQLGRRRAYLAGTGLFALASLACGLASSTGALVAARAVQGLGAAAMFATTLSLLGAAYQGRRRSVALGVWGAVSGAAAALGPVLGGVLTQSFGWRWIFFVNLPVAAVAMALTLRAVRPDGPRRGGRVDWAGTVAFALAAGAATYGVVRAGEQGWASARTLATFALALAALVVFVLVERRVAAPLIDLRLLRGRSFVTVLVAACAFNAAAFAVLPYTSIWLQTLLGMSPVRAGLALLPLAGTSFVIAALAGRLLHGAPARFVVGGGMVLIGAGTLAQGVLGAASSWTALLPGLVVAGLGVGLVSPGLAGAALASVPPRDAGMAGGAVNTARQLGYALGVAVFGTVATSAIGGSLHDKDAAHALAGGAAGALRGAFSQEALRTAFASGLNAAAWVAGAVGVLAGLAVLAWVRTPEPGPAGGEAARDGGARQVPGRVADEVPAPSGVSGA
ncbi:MFS transporter [Streptomyces sp. NPDC001941]|uniref:MFS transporter n=1 Tax=Streptomyces sp. NPDC001941 TaxID=3154659 RepID=UPI003317A6BE